MEIFEALRRRRAVRYFKPEAVPAAALRKLLYAAQRAPTGANAAYRRVLVVQDERIVNLVRRFAPGIQGNPAALLVIYTDLTEAQRYGRMGTELVPPIDAGAAAENVALAAVALGLGTCFTKAYAEVAIKEILGLPAGCRTELIVQVGYPRAEQPFVARSPRAAQTVYIDHYGRAWNPSEGA